MSLVVFASDLHLGHARITEFRQFDNLKFETERHHRDWLLGSLADGLNKRSRLIVAGDVAFTLEALEEFSKLPGEKILVRGNHDEFSTDVYSKVFSQIYGLWRYKEFWVSHAPIHPNEVRGKTNLHGHVHFESIKDPRYFNLCPEALYPLYNRPYCTLDEIRHARSDRKEAHENIQP